MQPRSYDVQEKTAGTPSTLKDGKGERDLHDNSETFAQLYGVKLCAERNIQEHSLSTAK